MDEISGAPLTPSTLHPVFEDCYLVQLSSNPLQCMMDQARQDKETCRYGGLMRETQTIGERRASAPSSDVAAARAKPQRVKTKPATAIFIHAGAGFHSHENEKVHLQACQT